MAKARAAAKTKTKTAKRVGSGGAGSESPTKAELIDALTRMQQTLAARRKLLCSIPRRGYSPDPNAPKMPLNYTIPSCGAGVVLRLIAEGQLDVITRTLVDALIAELRK